MEKRKVNKGIIFISIIFVITLLGGITGYIVNYKSNNKDVNKDNSDKDNKVDTTFELKKYSDDLVLPDKDWSKIESYRSNIGKYRDYIVFKTADNEKNGKFYQISTYFLKDNKLIKTRKSVTDNDIHGLRVSNNYYCTGEHKCVFDKDFEPDFPNTEYDYIRQTDNYYLIRKNGKFGLLNSKGETLIECKYDYILVPNNKYFFAIINNKVGVIDITGKVIIDFIYDGLEEEYFDFQEDIADTYNAFFAREGDFQQNNAPQYLYVADSINENLFLLEKDNMYYIINGNNKILFESEDANEYRFNSNLGVVERYITQNKILNSIEYYNLDGKLLKSINLSTYNIEPFYDSHLSIIPLYYDYYEFDCINTDFEMIELNNSTILYIDKSLNTREIKNIYFETYEYDEINSNAYFMNNKMYVKKENDKYSFYKVDGKLIVKDIVRIENNPRYGIIICKEPSRKCTVIDLNGNLLSDFEYTYYKNDRNYVYLTDAPGHALLNGVNGGISGCNAYNMSNEFERIRDNLFYTYNLKSYLLYDNNCNGIGYHGYFEVEKTDNDYIVAKYSKGFDIYDKDNNKINYINKDNVKLEKYIGEVDNKLFFIGNNTLYYIEL